MSMTFYLAAAGMVLAAFVYVCWPLLHARRIAWVGATGVMLVVGCILMYPLASNYQVRSAAFKAVSTATTEEQAREAASALTAELMEAPDNYSGWRLLGRVSTELGDFKAAEFAFRQAMRVGNYKDPELKVMLGEVLSFDSGPSIPEEASRLFIEAYNEAPTNPKAQWFAGLAYAALGDNAAAAGAWEALLASGPPENIASILRERVAVLRGLPNSKPAAAEEGPVSGELQLTVTLDGGIEPTWPASARLYVSVRDAALPGPPLAARQFTPDALPLTLSLDDRDAMVAGRTISSASDVEITARVSMSGDPLGGKGDYVGRLRVAAGGEQPLQVVINEVQP